MNLNYTALAKWALEKKDRPPIPDGGIHEVAEAYAASLSRIDGLIGMPAVVGAHIHGSHTATDPAWENGAAAVDKHSRLWLPVYNGVEGLYASVVIAMWSAFEVLAGDLWEAAVDSHPKGLAILGGEKSRIVGKAETIRNKAMKSGSPKGKDRGNQPTGTKAADKVVPLIKIAEISDDTFKIEGRMGQLLRRNESVKFATLSGIREAYASAFDEKVDDIDAALTDPVIDVLCAVRNLIVHRNGKCDDEYETKQAYIPGLPPLGIKQVLQLDSRMVIDLVNPVRAQSARLLTSVDEWLKRF